MAAGATGATNGKGSVAGGVRGPGSPLAGLVEQGRPPAAAEPAHGNQPASSREAANSSGAASAEAGKATGTARARPRTTTTNERGGSSRAARPESAFPKALAQLRAPPPAASPPAEGTAAATEPAAKAEASSDAPVAGDAASATVAAMLQCLQPVTQAAGRDPQGGDRAPEQEGEPAAALAGITAATAAAGVVAAAISTGSSASVPTGAATAQASSGGMAAAATGLDAQATVPSPPQVAQRPANGAAASSADSAGPADGGHAFESLATAIRGAALLDGSATGRDGAGSQAGDKGRDASAGAAGSAGNSASAAAGIAAALRTAGNVSTERTVPVPMHDRHWSQALAGQVLVLTDQRIDSATLRLSPEHLGPVEVHIDLQAQGVNVSFGAEHAETRTALEQALPQLRAAFAGAGLTLGQATVQQQMRQGSQNTQRAAQDQGTAADHREVTPAVIRSIGLVDEYA